MNLVVGHNHSRTKLIHPKKLKLKGFIRPLIGFKLGEVPKKYEKNSKRMCNHKGYSFYILLDPKDFKL